MTIQLNLALIATIFFLSSSSYGYVLNPYKALGIEKGADDAAIKRAYKKLALKYHPDKNPKGQAKFIEIQQAYEILSDAERKSAYDLGGSREGEYEHQRHQGSSRHYHHNHFQYQQQQQQEHAYNFYYQQQQQQQEQYERALPSNTSFLTTSNFRGLVIHGGRPWLVMFYSESSAACREFSPAWESLWKLLGGTQGGIGNRDGASVGLGRIHVRFQRTLVQILARAGGPLANMPTEDMLPLLMAVPSGCTDTSCFVLYRGPVRLSSLQDFIADRLLRLPLVPQLEPQRVATFLRRASPYKVVVMVFGRGGGSGSLTLRSLAARQKNMLTIARGQVQDGDVTSAAAWQSALNLSSPPAPGQLVFLRGPGTAPRTLVVPPGKASELQNLIDEEGLLWQEVPPLRPATGASLGCLWGRAAVTSGTTLLDMCVILVAPRGPQLDEGRRRMALLGRYLATLSTKRDPAVAATASAYMDGKLRLVWLDASAQHPLCAWLMGVKEAMRPTDIMPPPGTNKAGRAAALVQALAAAAARSPALTRAVCGLAPLDVLGRVRVVTAAAARAVGLVDMAASLQTRPAAHVVVIRPSVDGSSWLKGAALYRRHGRPVFMHAVNADFDVGSLERGLDVDLPKLAAWINQMHSEPDRNLHASTVFPPGLQPDEEPGAVEYLVGRLYDAVIFVLKVVMNGGTINSDGSVPPSFEMQVANLLVALLALLLVRMAFNRRGNAMEERDPTVAGGAQRASVTAASATPGGSVGAKGSDLVEKKPANAGDDARSRGGKRAVSLNRRGLSPSWRSGRRGEVSGSVDEAGSANNDGVLSNRTGSSNSEENNNRLHPDPRPDDDKTTSAATLEASASGKLREKPEESGGGTSLTGPSVERRPPACSSVSGKRDAAESAISGDNSGEVKAHAGSGSAGTAVADSRQETGCCEPGADGAGATEQIAVVTECTDAVGEVEDDGWLTVSSPRRCRAT